MAFSKKEVNRAGALIAGQIARVAAGERLDEQEMQEGVFAVEVIDWWRTEHARPLTLVAANLRYYAAEVGEPVVAQRLKRLPTIADKLAREPKMKLARMGDIGGVRAVVLDQASADHVAKRLRRNWTITRFSDYVTNPKPDGYRALHLINRHRGRLIEVQIRTVLQDRWANLVESLSRSVAPGLKYGKGPLVVREFLVDLSSLNAEFEFDSSALDRFSAKFQELESWIDNVLEEQRYES